MKFEKVGVIGAGQMGSGIAQVAAQHGHSVLLMDVSESALNKSVGVISASCDRFIKKNLMDEKQKIDLLGKITTHSSLSDLKSCTLVIEAATENLDLKLKILSQVGSVVDSQALICSNTSSLSITRLASVIQYPERVSGMHFMNPVPLMKLVEGIRGLQTSDETFYRVRQFCEQLGKIFVESQKDMPGFIVNRILMPMINEAIFTLHEGIAEATDIDSAMKLGTNQPMGPLALADFIGLDTCLAIMNVLYEGFSDSKYRPCPLLVKYVEAGWLGKKVGKGFYEYEH